MVVIGIQHPHGDFIDPARFNLTCERVVIIEAFNLDLIFAFVLAFGDLNKARVGLTDKSKTFIA